MRQALLLLAAALPLTVMGGAAHAVKWVSGQEFTGHCRAYLDAPTSLDGVVCVAYIQGFLGGAEATDAEVERAVRAEYAERATLLDRAVETRVRSRVRQFGATYYAHYCLPVAEPVTRVVANIIAYIDAHPEAETLNAQETVYGALQEFYPCAED